MNELLRRLLFLPPQESTVAGGLDALHYFVIGVTMFGAVAVTAAGLVFVVRYRRRHRAAEAGAATMEEPRQPPRPMTFTVELGVFLGLLGLFVMWWFIGFRQFMRLRVAPADAMLVYVTGKKWMWEFDYPEGPRSMSVLYVPVGKPVKLLMTSRDVIHSFYVPEFRIKQDVVPGRYTTVWFEARRPGRFHIFCTEYCGTGHSTMRGEVVVLAAPEFDDWLAGRTDTAPAGAPRAEPSVYGELAPREELGMVRMGERAAAQHGCLRCHTVDGAPHIGPTWAGLLGSEIMLTDGSSLRIDESYLTESMMDPNVKIRQGFQALMPSYQGKLAPAEAAAIVEYIRSLRRVRPQLPIRPEIPGALPGANP